MDTLLMRDNSYQIRFFADISTLFILLFQYLNFLAYSGHGSRYIAMLPGAVIGLSIGYLIKYFLDKKYVFIHKEEVAA